MGILENIGGMLQARGQRGIAGIWLNEHDLVKATRKVREAGFKKFEAISPYPIHGIDEAAGIPRSWIPWVTFTFGLTGCVFGLWFTWWTSAVDYPINVGGKPMWSLPAFVPVIFECTILLAALSSVGALIFAAGLPKLDPPIIDPALTSHKFGLFIPDNDTGFSKDKVEKLFKELGAKEIKQTEF